MTDRELTPPYEPNPALRALYRRFFDRIKVDQTWVGSVRELTAQGSVVHVLRSLNVMDFLALDYLTQRFELPRIRFVNDLGLWVLNPSVGRGYDTWIRKRSATDRLRRTVRAGGSAMLFLKRPPNVLDRAAGARGGRGLKAGDDLLQALLDEQRAGERPLLLLPQEFVWSRGPDTRGAGALDFVLGSREWPGALRTVAQLLQNYQGVQLRAGEPLNLAELLAGSSLQDDPVLMRRATYAVLRRLERERRSVTGPAAKSPQRVRQEILRTPRLRATIDQLAEAPDTDQREVTRRAATILRELQATPERRTVKALDLVFHRIFHRIYAGIEYSHEDIERVRDACKDQTLVLLPSHRSHVDYLILSYVFEHEGLQLPLVASGDNLNFFPAGLLLRRGGGFFIRRSFKGDRMYAAVVDAYIRRLIRDGYPIEIFLEGGRSRTGKLLTPKFGLLSMVVDAASALPQRRTCFVPVSIGYERVVESGAYERELRGADKQREDAAGLLQSRKLLRHRYGRISLQIGEMFTLPALRQELKLPPAGELEPAARRRLVEHLGNRVMDEINRVTAVTPGALTALALLSGPCSGLTHEQLLERCSKLLWVLRQLGARVTSATADAAGPLRSESILEAVQMFVEAELVEAYPPQTAADGPRPRLRRLSQAGPGARYRVPGDKRLALDTSKNVILHFFLVRSLIAIAVTDSTSGGADREQLRGRVETLARLFQFEFRTGSDAERAQRFDATLEDLIGADQLQLMPTGPIRAGPGQHGWTGQQWLALYVGILSNFLEGYRIAARGLTALLRGPLSNKDLVKKTLALGTRMHLTGEIERREAVSKPVIENAYQSLLEQGELRLADGKLELPDARRTAAAVANIEAQIAHWLPERAG